MPKNKKNGNSRFYEIYQLNYLSNLQNLFQQSFRYRFLSDSKSRTFTRPAAQDNKINVTLLNMAAGVRRSNSCKLQQTISERNRNLGLFLKIWLICRIPCHSFTCQWIRKASIVLCLVLESLTTHVNEVDQSGRVFCS